ncbi:MAG: PilN domain-containing protein [Thermodesulfovibrionia bacterium]
MIRINLLQERKVKKAMPLQSLIIPAIVFTTLTVIVVGAYAFYLMSNLSTLKADKSQKEKKLAEIKDAIKQVEDFEKDNEIFRQKNTAIERLKKMQILPLRLLDEVSARLSKGVWLESLQDKGGTINITGYGFTNPDIVDFVQALKQSEYITDVALLESQMKESEGYTLYQFKLSFKMKE